MQQIDFKGLADWVEILRSGQHIDSSGRARAISIKDLDAIVENFDAAQPIPHVITHASLYSPFAYAHGVAVKREGESLFVRSDRIEPQFERLLEQGRLYSRSVRLLPTDNGWRLGHIAWLGADPPAVEGLAPVQFGAPEDGVDLSSFPFSPPSGNSMTTEVTPETQQPANQSAADFAAMQEQNKALLAQLAAAQHQIRTHELATKVNGWLHDKRITPAEAEGMAEFMAALPDEPIDFASPDGGAPKKQTALEWFASKIDARKPLDLGPNQDIKQDADFAKTSQANDAEIARRARAFHKQQQDAGLNISYAQAVDAVRASSAT